MEGNTLNLLADLLKQNEGEEEEDNDLDCPGASPYITPGAIGPTTGNGTGSNKKDGKDIWSSENIFEGEEHDYTDARQQPKYEMLFKQAVGSEDVFLGMGNKTPLTSSCEDMLLKIYLPDTKFKEVELIITEKFLDCRTPKYRLGLHLPHRVDSEHSSAKWLDAKNVLEISLKLVREYDFINQ